MLNCVQCCLACFEKTLKFLTRNAYIEMAISGNGFLYSAKKSFKFMVNNALNLATINAITFILIWFSKILLSGAIGAAAFYWQKQKFPETAYNYNFSAAITKIFEISPFLGLQPCLSNVWHNMKSVMPHYRGIP